MVSCEAGRNRPVGGRAYVLFADALNRTIGGKSRSKSSLLELPKICGCGHVSGMRLGLSLRAVVWLPQIHRLIRARPHEPNLARVYDAPWRASGPHLPADMSDRQVVDLGQYRWLVHPILSCYTRWHKTVTKLLTCRKWAGPTFFVNSGIRFSPERGGG